MKRPPAIPTYNLRERGKGSLEVGKVEEDRYKKLLSAHRDDNYVLIFQESGTSTAMVDFQKVAIRGAAIFCILPGQIHYGLSADKPVVWAVAVDAGWISPEFRSIFMEISLRNRPLPIGNSQVRLLKDSIRLLKIFDEQTKNGLPEQALRSMLDVCLALFASVLQKEQPSASKTNLRPLQITGQFRKLALANFRTIKSPADYAASLNISPAYLTEVVKKTTGYPVTHWIHQEIILEAKRELFYTSKTVKEIAHELGYTDAGYFNRLFRKVAGHSPLEFRQKYPK